MQLLRELGRVEYIALTTHAYEHKLFVAPFSRKFPNAKVCLAGRHILHLDRNAGLCVRCCSFHSYRTHALWGKVLDAAPAFLAYFMSVSHSDESASGSEHKAPAKRTCCMQVYVAPHQWSFPLNLPVQLFGIFPTGLLEEEGQYPWGDELDLKVFSANLAQGAPTST